MHARTHARTHSDKHSQTLTQADRHMVAYWGKVCRAFFQDFASHDCGSEEAFNEIIQLRVRQRNAVQICRVVEWLEQ